MKVAVYSIHNFERDFILKANAEKHHLVLLEERLSETTASLAKGCQAICIFTGDKANAAVLESLYKKGVKYLALRSAGFNHVDLNKAKELKMKVTRVPAYSPYAIAEHTVALILALNRKLIRAHHRIMDLNFSLDGLVGFDMNGKTVGIVGTGKIGSVLARILHGFGCRILAHDREENKKLIQDFNVKYTDYQTLLKDSDIVSLHLPLTENTRYLIDEQAIKRMKVGVMLINTSRGGLVNTKAVIQGLKTGHIGAIGLDVYEEEEGLFFEDHSEDILQDDTIARLMTFKNVLITSHQAFLTDTALKNISETTIYNLDCFEKGIQNENEILRE
ncbi:2-hydroxyacid dehydrogenase [Xanthovirga aplysinae]|uniref:2-hydroxyacid dehydrogenase n=1 Tax=Xanthovirga aplysinae TaxID=2529853 RepID=UPI0012BC54D9|nr:2-hydroxyacid dehydrogenase [Xanthovirga aplysinae]MTI30077.1 2-hydroxyacid dehydrogenase [Xanthovirga aplysinae]